MSEEFFSIRRDQNGLRPVYNLGNELGDCPQNCAFCGVGKSPQVTSEENIENFERIYADFRKIIQGPYHPVVYNQGNCTNPKEFSWKTLNHILKRFHGDPNVVYLSINSRESYATVTVLERLAVLRLSYPVHFVFGIESFSPRTYELLGKNTVAEMERFNAKLRSVNSRYASAQPLRGYTFGLDVNLVFLPELYLKPGESKTGNEATIQSSWVGEFRCLLATIDPIVPTEINLHPYYSVAAIPYEDADLSLFMQTLPELQRVLEVQVSNSCARPPHIFVGVEGTGYESSNYRRMLGRWGPTITEFNHTGKITWMEP